LIVDDDPVSDGALGSRQARGFAVTGAGTLKQAREEIAVTARHRARRPSTARRSGLDLLEDFAGTASLEVV
jgi:hypothetical protein